MSTKKSNPKKVVKATTVEQPVIEHPVQESQPSQQSQVENIKVAEIVPNPANPRKYFDEESLTELAQNIREHGVLQPVTVRVIPEENENGKMYEIVFGERRFRAAKMAGLDTIPCMVRNLNDDAAFDLMVSENLQRQDIRPSEEAIAFKSILERGNSITYISERFGKSESFVHSRLILVRLIPEITTLFDREEISIGMAVEIARLEPEIQENLFKEHLETEIAFNNWKSLSLKAFRDKLESTYTVLISRFSFDKTECESCVFNSELHSLFPNIANSRCTRTTCLVKKQEKHILDSVLAAILDENVDVYVGNNCGGIHADIISKLAELGIAVKSGTVYPMPEIPVFPDEKDFAGNLAMYEQAQKDFHTKQTKWNTLQKMFEDGLARKVVMLENLAVAFGYIMVPQQKPTPVSNSENQVKPDKPTGGNNSGGSTNSSSSTQSPKDNKNGSTTPVKNIHSTVKPDLLSTLQEKYRKNREEALEKVIEDARMLIKDMDIPPVEITPFEDTLIDFVLLSFLDKRHYEFFGLIEGQILTEEVALGLYIKLTDEQRNQLKRDFLIKHLTIKNGISKRAALLIELAKHHFPAEMAEIENAQNEEYLKKWTIIKEQMDKIQSEYDEMQEVA